MNETVAKTYTDFALPPSVVSRLDVSRLVREVEKIDNSLTTSAVQVKVGLKVEENFSISEQLRDFLQLNTLSITADGHGRTELIKQLRLLKDHVPTIHMTFAVEADRESLGQLVAWLRSSTNPQVVITIGLQPALVAGVYLRTTNHVHDLSLRAKLASSHDVLIRELEKFRV